MCEGSIYAKHRLANARESLEVRAIPDYNGMRGLYSQDPKGPILVCIRKWAELVISHLKLEQGMAIASAYQYDGKRNVRVKFQHVAYADRIVLPNGSVIPLAALKVGTKIEIGQPAKPKDPAAKGMAAVKAALVEQEKTEPTPVRKRIVKPTVDKIKKRILAVARRPRATSKVK